MPNHLQHEASAYLKQHMNNPVDWHPWGSDAFELAKSQKKPIFLSVGYSTCHWCHVMEHESFEDQTVADTLNQNFISIKVDREEHPEVDKIYMDAVHAMNKRGGWPMSVFLTPDLKPFFGGTYFPKLNFLHLLEQIKTVWATEPDQIVNSADHLTKHLQSQAQFHDHDLEQGKGMVNALTKQALELFDPLYGGFGAAPKFPPSVKLMVLLRQYHSSNDPQVLKTITKTLDGMCYGGLYDHLGGGFARYSTDSEWLVPHFEKMLYDNALLIRIYLETYQVTGLAHYAEVAKETLDYVLRDMTAPEGGFYAAEDADSEGHEGLFYVFGFSELKALLTPDELKTAMAIYGATEPGNFEGRNILNLNPNAKWDIKQSPELICIHKKLLQVRNQRIRPLRDEKIITSWCALMIETMAKAYQVLNDKKYLRAAQRAADFLITKHLINGKLIRRSVNNEGKHEAALEDYAYLISALIALYQSDFDERWLKTANEMQVLQNEIFSDHENGGYFFGNPNTQSLIVSIKEVHDDAIPNSNAVSCLNLQRLYHFGYASEYKAQAEKILKLSIHRMQNYPSAYAQMVLALDFYFSDPETLVIVSGQNENEFGEEIQKLQKKFLPYSLLAGIAHSAESNIPLISGKSALNGKTTLYRCHEGRCEKPETV